MDEQGMISLVQYDRERSANLFIWNSYEWFLKIAAEELSLGQLHIAVS